MFLSLIMALLILLSFQKQFSTGRNLTKKALSLGRSIYLITVKGSHEDIIAKKKKKKSMCLLVCNPHYNMVIFLE